VANRTLAPPTTTTDGAETIVARVEWTLAGFLGGEVAALTAVDPALSLFARTARDSVLAGGKRLRPVFAYWGWRGLVGPAAAPEPLLPALASLELLHAFALVHDDVMDSSELRRGRPTAHRLLADGHTTAGRRGDAAHFGRSAAVLVGDLCLVWADRLMATAAVPAPALAEARACYDQMRIEAMAGQYLDLLGEADPGAWSVERALRVARHKTASYTVLRPLRFGAALAGEQGQPAGRRAAVLRAYDRYGAAVGEAFQLRDDLLGAYGDPRVTGKPAGEDLRTGKPTALLMMARQLADRAQRRDLDRALAAARQGDAVDLAAVVAATGAAQRIEAMIEERVATALAALDAGPVSAGAGQALRRLALAAAHRRA
jgi:geranylgeranyl diphosphate synthase type I